MARRLGRALCLTLVLLLPACTPPTPDIAGQAHRAAVEGSRGVVAAESPAAMEIALAVLDDGGNAVDAAAAAVLAVSVARPQSCGLGGGGFLVLRTADGETAALDFRETAPAAFDAESLSGPGMHRARTGHRTVGVPGTVAGLDAALERYGTRTLAELVGPAEALARDGVALTPAVAGAIRDNAARLRRFDAAEEQFLPGGEPPAAGDRLVQADLAHTLALIGRDGPDAFYRGPIARLIAREMEAAGPDGMLTRADLEAYEPRWSDPLIAGYRGHEVVTIGPPSSGGVAVLQMLGILEGFDLRRAGFGSADHLHLLAEAQKLAFADRAEHLADPDAMAVPTDALLDPAYLERRRDELDPTRAASYQPGAPEPGGTTHVSVIDEAGNAVALTCTIETGFGSAVVAPGTGFVLNNQLTDFGEPGTANAPGPGKRPRSSMTPAIVVRDGTPVLVVGGAGGSRIIMGTLQTIVNVVDFRMGIADAVDAPRVEGTLGDLAVEHERIASDVLDELEGRGHRITRAGEYRGLPRIQAAGVDRRSGQRAAVSDPRTEWASAAQE